MKISILPLAFLAASCVADEPARPAPRACPGVMEVASMRGYDGRFLGVVAVIDGPARAGAVWPEWAARDGSTIIGLGAVIEPSVDARAAWIGMAAEEPCLAIRYVPYDGSPGCVADVLPIDGE
jgi:hypothetical protein